MDASASIAAVPAGVLAFALHAASAGAAPVVETHPARVLVEAPSEVTVGESVPFAVLLQEEWGREGPPAPRGVDRGARLEVASTDSLADLEPALVLERGDAGFRSASIMFRTPGLHRIVVDGEAGVTGRSNPVRVLEAPPAERVFWGDLHAHLHGPGSGHAGEVDLDAYAQLVNEGFRFARDASLLDFAAFTEHIQTAGGLARERADGRTPWDVLRAGVESAASPGRFVTFPGFEWQGEAGDHCVIYPTSMPLDAPAEFDALVRSVTVREALLTAHAVFLPTTFEQPKGLGGIEVTRDSKSTEWLGKAALARGVVRPFLGCSDTHGGALGATSLTGVRAPALGRAEILTAIRSGRSWATNGERIVLDFTVDASAPLPRAVVRGLGTAPIDRIEIHRNGELVAEGRGFGESEEFEFVWEDASLLRTDCLASPVCYHARVVQTSSNRYDPSERDLAISSPIVVTPTPAHLDATHGRRGGHSETAPGAALELLRDSWSRLGPAAGRSPQADAAKDSPLPAWTSNDITALRSAVRSLQRLAVRDSSLEALARDVAAIPDVADAIARMAAVEGRLHETAAKAGPTPALVDLLRADVARARAAVEVAEASLQSGDRAALERAWFAPRILAAAATALFLEVEAYAVAPVASKPVARGDPEPVARLAVPIDPRTATLVGAVAARASELHAAHEASWGYTEPSAAPGAERGALRVRVVAEGSPRGARVVGSKIAGSIPLRGARTGWTAVVPAKSVPVAGEPPLEIALDPPALVSRVFVEGPDGAPLHAPGRVAGLSLRITGELAHVRVDVADDPVFAELVGRPEGEATPRILWAGLLETGSTELAFPVAALGDPHEARLRWGFGGWRRRAGVEVPGHDVARALGFGVLGDDRAAIALETELVLVDPESGDIARVPYPESHRHEPGREFGAAALSRDVTVIRGANGAAGGWVAALASTGEWSSVASGPEAGTIATHPRGGLTWLAGDELHHRDASGGETASRRLDAAGRLLAIDAAGDALVRTPTGDIVRASASDGRVLERIEGVVIGIDASGAALQLDGFDRRHAELATGARLVRASPGGGRSEPFPIAVKPSPVLEPAIATATRSDGGLLVLGGSVGWRCAPDHDWWGATVELWDEVWVGETPLQ